MFDDLSATEFYLGVTVPMIGIAIAFAGLGWAHWLKRRYIRNRRGLNAGRDRERKTETHALDEAGATDGEAKVNRRHAVIASILTPSIVSSGAIAGSAASAAHEEPVSSGLVARNIVVAGRRTTAKLEPALWEALEMIARRRNASINELCTYVAENRMSGGGFTAALHIFIVEEMRNIASAKRKS